MYLYLYLSQYYVREESSFLSIFPNNQLSESHGFYRCMAWTSPVNLRNLDGPEPQDTYV